MVSDALEVFLSTGTSRKAAEHGDPNTGNLWTPGRFALALACLVLAAFPGVALGLESFVFRDFGFYGYPLAHWFRESVWRGEWPLWNPLNNFGIPFLAQWSTLALYPPSLLYLVLPLPWSLNLFDLAHLWWGGVGMFFLARSWRTGGWGAAVAGMGFAFNGISLNCLIWPHLTASLAWMPWVILAAQTAWREGGRRIPVAACAGAMQMMTGGPEFTLITWALAASLCLAETVAGRASGAAGGTAWMLPRLAAVVGCVTAIAAAQLLPFLELTLASHRSAQFSTGSWSMPGWGWANFLVPLFHCEPSPQRVAFQPGQLWTSSYYVNLTTVVLAAVAVLFGKSRHGWLLIAAALGSVLFAMGDHTPLYGWLRHSIPGVGFFRYPIKCVATACFALPLLAGMGAELLQRREDRGIWKGLYSTAAALAFLVVVVMAWAGSTPELAGVWPATRSNGIMRLVFLGLALAGIAAASLHPHVRIRIAAMAAVPLLIWLDVLNHAPWQNPTVPVAVMQPGLKPLDPMPALGEGRAMISAAANLTIYQRALPDVQTNFVCNRLALSCNTTLLDGLPVVDGFYSLYLKPSRELHMLLYEKVDAEYPALMDFLGVQRVTAPGGLFEFTHRPTAMPLISAGQQVVFGTDTECLQAVQSTLWDPRRTIFLPMESTEVLGKRASCRAVISGSRWQPHQVEFDVDSAGPTLAAVAQAWYPAWTATVDGMPARVWRANHAFQAVGIPEGRHHVVLRYEDRWFRWGGWISGIALISCAAWMVQRRNRPSAPCA